MGYDSWAVLALRSSFGICGGSNSNATTFTAHKTVEVLQLMISGQCSICFPSRWHPKVLFAKNPRDKSAWTDYVLKLTGFEDRHSVLCQRQTDLQCAGLTRAQRPRSALLQRAVLDPAAPGRVAGPAPAVGRGRGVGVRGPGDPGLVEGSPGTVGLCRATPRSPTENTRLQSTMCGFWDPKMTSFCVAMRSVQPFVQVI